MGAAGQRRAETEFDWPVILRRYAELAARLGEIRAQALSETAEPWPQRTDPFRRFAHFASKTLDGDWQVRARPDAAAHLAALLPLSMTNYAIDPQLLAREALPALLVVLETDAVHTVRSTLAAAGLEKPMGVRALMWLWKFDLVEVLPSP